jgi:serine/threonine protein kinase/Tol biopolymer transport system component
MTPEREREVERICQAALDRPPAERAAFVAAECAGDESLRGDVEHVLAHDGEVSGFLETPAVAVAAQRLRGAQTLITGQRIGAYTILSHLGGGGMGEVYRARDTTLGREVAVKVLPTIFTSDAERLARFEREARLLAALNHPNIATIHGVEHVDGIHALILEVVDGETVAEAIDGRPVSVDRALAIARQIADALEAAHAKGIVHRDLKPANIKIRPDGVVKVLDFGLAKALDDLSGTDPLHSPTITVGRTAEGAVLGTAAYMSPEQARGKPIDKRTDVWAFGCVLYEMLTGRTAFARETITDTLAAIVDHEPDWTAIPATVPENIRRLLRRCLQKDPARRLRDIADARLEFDDAFDETYPRSRPTSSVSRGFQRLLWFAALMGVVAAVIAAWYFRGSAVESREVRFEIATPPTTEATSLALSPDGRAIVFAAASDGTSQLWLRALDAVSPRLLPGTDNASLPFWSPNSRSVGFFADGQLKTIALDSGSVRALGPSGVQGGAWSEDGTILFSQGAGGGLRRVSADGGASAPVTEVTLQRNVHRAPQFLPGGRRFLFYANGTEPGIYVGEIGGPESASRILDAQAAIYASGHLLFVRQNTLFAQPFNPARLSLSGEPVAIAVGLIASAEGFGAALSASDTGVIAVRLGPAGELRRFTWFNRSGQELESIAGSNVGSPFHFSLSPNGRSLAFARNEGGKPSDIWLLDVGRGVSTRFTFDEAFDLNAVWSPDGKRIAFSSNRRGTFDPYVKEVEGDRSELLLHSDREAGPATDWSRDGRFILSSRQGESEGVWALPLDGTSSAFAVADTAFNETNAQFSFDGGWVAYQSNESGQVEIYIQRFPGPGRKWKVSSNGGVQVRWREDGSELYYLAPDNRIMAVPIRLASTDDSVSVRAPVPLFAVRLNGDPRNSYARSYDVSRDGERFLVDTMPELTLPITVVMNWESKQ